MARILNCRSCNATRLTPILDLGVTPLANSILSGDQLDEPEFKAPLGVVRCENCSIIQITETVAPERLFTKYAYFSSFSDTMLQHAKDLVEKTISERELGESSFVVEIGSNDGYLLKNYKAASIPILGIEPAVNVAALANERGVTTVARFFNAKYAEELVNQGKTADVVHVHNVLGHVPEINDFAKGLSLLLKSDGIAIIEVPYAVEMIDRVEFDTIYHEHVFYYTLTALKHLFERAGLAILDVDQVSIHGGSLRVKLGKAGTASQKVEALLRTESERGFNAASAYEHFSQRVLTLKQQLVSLLNKLKREGCRMAAYGAAAKGTTLLNYFQVGTETLEFVVDRSTAKQGHYMPGVHLPIYSPAELFIRRPDYVLLLTWNFAEEILRQQSEYLRQGGRFIVPLPEPRIVSGDTPSLAATDSLSTSPPVDRSLYASF